MLPAMDGGDSRHVFAECQQVYPLNVARRWAFCYLALESRPEGRGFKPSFSVNCGSSRVLSGVGTWISLVSLLPHSVEPPL